MRQLALVALAGQAVFPLGWLVAGGLSDGYSHERQYVSELGARGMEYDWIFELGLLGLALSWVAIGLVLRHALPDPRWSRVSGALFLVAGVAAAAVVVLPVDCSASIDAACEERQRAGDLSWQHYAHGLIAWAEQLVLAATPFVVGRALPAGPLRHAAFALGAIGLVLGAAQLGIQFADEDRAGIYQRAGLVIVQGWSCLLACALLLVSYVGSGAATSVRR
jgi:hypothetical protein